MRYLCTAGAPAANPAQGQSYGATNTGRGHYSNSNNNSISNNCNGGNYHVDIADTMAMTQFSSSLPVHVPLPVPVPGLPPAAGSSAVSSNHRITYPISSCSGLNSHSSGRNTFYSSPMDGSMPQPPSAALAHMQSLHSMHSAVHHPLHNQLAYHPVHQNSGHGMIQQQHQPQHQSHLSPPYQQQLQQQQQHVPFDAQSQLKMNSVSASAHFAPPSGVNRPQPISSSPHVSYSQYPGVPGGATASSSFLQWSSPQQSQPQYQQQYQQYQHQLQQQQQQQSYPPSAQGTGGSKCPSTPVQQHAAVNLLPAPQADCAAATQERGDCDDASRCSDVHASQPLLLQHYQSDQHHSNQREHHNQPQAQHIALSSLRSLGVPAEVVGQLVDLQAYLLRKVGRCGANNLFAVFNCCLYTSVCMCNIIRSVAWC